MKKNNRLSLALHTLGHTGGWTLARAPQEITLADVFEALGERLFAQEDGYEPASCAVDRAMHRRITSVMNKIECSLIERLKAIFVSEIHS